VNTVINSVTVHRFTTYSYATQLHSIATQSRRAAHHVVVLDVALIRGVDVLEGKVQEEGILLRVVVCVFQHVFTTRVHRLAGVAS
jgi:hypothetical protein